MTPRTAWPVVAKHLDEAQFAMARFDRSLSSASLTLEAVARGPERILESHVDGLLIGGAPVIEEVLLPALGAEDAPPSSLATVIVMTLLRARRPELASRALQHAAPDVRRAAVRAFGLVANPTLDPWIAQNLAGRTPLPRAALLELASERGLGVETLAGSLQSAEPEELIAALKVASRADPDRLEVRVVELLQHPHPGVRDAAMVTALHYGSAYGWATCLSLATDPAAPHPLAMALLGGLGEPAHHLRLAEMAAVGSHRAGALRALGLSGNVGAVPLLLHYARADDAPTADIAIEALGTSFGADLDVPREEAGAALTEWWSNAQGRFEPSRRYLGGAPVRRATFAEALTRFPTRRRFLIALLLSIRTGGAARVSTRAFTATQRAQIAEVAARAPDEPWARQLTSF